MHFKTDKFDVAKWTVSKQMYFKTDQKMIQMGPKCWEEVVSIVCLIDVYDIAMPLYVKHNQFWIWNYGDQIISHHLYIINILKKV